MEKKTPTMIDVFNFLRNKAAHNEVVLLRVGDFYETYDRDAQILSGVIGTICQERNGHKLYGIPAHYLKKLEEKLIKDGYIIGVADKEYVTKIMKEMEQGMENKKDIDTKAFRHFNVCGMQNSFYWFNSEKGTLEQVSIGSVVFNLVTGSIIYNLTHNGLAKKVVAKDGFESEFAMKLYENETDYLNQKAFDRFNGLNLWDLNISLNRSFYVNEDRCGLSQMVSHIIKNGEVVAIHLKDYVSEIVVSYDERCLKTYFINYIDEKETIDFQHAYSTRDELIKFESIRIEDNDGKVRYTDAPMARLRLSKEQQKAVDDFLAAKTALKNAGVGLLFDSCDWSWYVINIRDFKSVRSDEHDCSFEEYLDNGILRIDSLPEFMKINFNFDASFNYDHTSVMCALKDK